MLKSSFHFFDSQPVPLLDDNRRTVMCVESFFYCKNQQHDIKFNSRKLVSLDFFYVSCFFAADAELSAQVVSFRLLSNTERDKTVDKTHCVALCATTLLLHLC